MKKLIAFILALCLLLSLSAAAFAAGGPKISKQPESATTDEKGTVVFKIEASGYKGLTWRFVNPETGEEYTANTISKVFKKIKVTGPNKATVTLKKVPAEMDGWVVYCHLTGNGFQVDSDKVILSTYGASPAPAAEPEPVPAAEPEPVPAAQPEPAAKAEEPAAEPAPANTEPAAVPAETVPAPASLPEPAAYAEDGTPLYMNQDGNLVAEPPMVISITIRGENVTLYPLDAYGNLREDAGASVLSFDTSATVAVRSAGPVRYWEVNGIRIDPVESLTGFTLRNVTRDLVVTAVPAGTAAAGEESGKRVTVTCEGCTFTYAKGGLKNVVSGSVPAGAAITVIADDASAAGGYSINNGNYEKEGKSSFRLTVSEDTTIKAR